MLLGGAICTTADGWPDDCDIHTRASSRRSRLAPGRHTAAPGAELGGVTGKTMDDLDDETYGNQYVNVGPYDK
jgi:hypothetical protein